MPQIYGSESSDLEIERVHGICFDLVKQYQTKCSLEEGNNQSNSVSSSQQEVDDPLSGFDLFVSVTSTTESMKSELEKYLEEFVLPRSIDFDILAWWKINRIKYPILNSIARDILAIPITTLAL